MNYDDLVRRQNRYDELMREYGSDYIDRSSQKMLDLHKKVVAIMDSEDEAMQHDPA